jgi:hypothetical protein
MNCIGEPRRYDVLIIAVVAVSAVVGSIASDLPFWCVLGTLFLALASLGVIAASQIGQAMREMGKGVDAGVGALKGNDRPSDCPIAPEIQLPPPEWHEPNF